MTADEARARIRDLLPPEEVARLDARENAHWITDGDSADEDWCFDCCTAEVTRLITAGYPDAIVDGGWDSACDSWPSCSGCGRELSGMLTDYGVEQELEHYETHGPDAGLLNVLESVPRKLEERAVRLAAILIATLEGGAP